MNEKGRIGALFFFLPPSEGGGNQARSIVSSDGDLMGQFQSGDACRGTGKELRQLCAGKLWRRGQGNLQGGQEQAVFSEFIVQVRSRCPSRRTDKTNRVALLYALAFVQPRDKTLQMAISCGDATAVGQDDKVAIAVLLAHEFDPSVRGRSDPRSRRCRKVRSAVSAPFLQDRMQSHRKSG